MPSSRGAAVPPPLSLSVPSPSSAAPPPADVAHASSAVTPSTSGPGLARIKNLMTSYYAPSAGTPNGGGSAPAPANLPVATNERSSQFHRTSSLTSVYEDASGLSEEDARQQALGAKDLDSPHFKVDEWLADKLRSTPFSQLMDCDEDLSKQIKVLDQQVQDLVYANYTKFISATDTMRSMKDKLIQVEGEVAGLEGRTAAVATATKRMNDRNSERRNEIARLDRLGRLLSKLEVVFHLAHTIRVAETQQEIEAVVRMFSSASPFLTTHRHIASIKAIEESARLAMLDLKERLKKSLNAERIGLYVSCCRALGESKAASAKTFLTWQRENNFSLVAFRQQQLQNPSASSSAVPSDVAVTSSFEAFIKTEVRESLLDPMVAAIGSLLALLYDEDGAVVLASADASPEDVVVREAMLEYARETTAAALSRIRARVDAEPSTFRLSFAIPNDAPAGSPTSSPSLTPASSTQTTVALRGLSFAVDELISLSTRLPTFVAKSLRVADRAGELAERYVRRQISCVVGELRRRATERVADDVASTDDAPMLRRRVEECSAGILSDASTANHFVDGLLRSASDVARDVGTSFDDLFRFQMQEWCGWMAASLRPEGAAMPPPGKATKTTVLAKALVAKALGAACVQVESPLRLADRKQAKAWFMGAMEEGVRAFSTLLGMEAAAGTVCADLREDEEAAAIEDPALLVKHGRPSSVSSSVVQMLNDIGMASRIVRAFGLSTGRQQSRSGAALGASTPTPTGRAGASPAANLRSDISRMFANTQSVFDPVDPDAESMLVAALRIALKTWIESIREVVLPKHAFQRIQLDAHFVRYVAPLVFADNLASNVLTAEVVNSARDRCADSAALEVNVMDQLCSAKKDVVRSWSALLAGGLAAATPAAFN